MSGKAPNRELELKLVPFPVDAGEADFATLMGLAAERVEQSATYFDTPNQYLRKHGWSLRIRSVGDRKIQTAKQGNTAGAGIFSRSEWEEEVEGDTPIIDDDSPLAHFLGERAERLRPSFTVETVRSKWPIREGHTLIEAVADRGEVKAGSRQMPFWEMELELIEGDPEDLFSVARRLTSQMPLRLGVQTKSDRGYSLLSDKSGPFKAESIPLDSKMTAAEALQAIAFSCVRQFRLNEDLLLQEADPGPVHQARVALRRLRSVLVLFKPVIKSKWRKRVNAELRWLAAALGDVRNLDVIMPELSDDGRRKAAAAREAALTAAVARLESKRGRRVLLDIAEGFSAGTVLRKKATRVGIVALAEDALEDLNEDVQRVSGDIREISDADRHETRKAAKKLRYATEFVAALYDEGKIRKHRMRFHAALEVLQDRLGELNDLTFREELLGSLGIENPPPAITHDALLAEAAASMETLRDQKLFWGRAD
jgi:inorganic triphosphatase YgiF